MTKRPCAGWQTYVCRQNGIAVLSSLALTGTLCAQVPLGNLRPEFQRQVESLRKKVAANIQPKQVLGKTVNGDMFAELATSYVTALNEGGVPVISTALERAVQSQCRVSSATYARAE